MQVRKLASRKLAGIYFVKDLGGTGYTDYINGGLFGPNAGFIVLDIDAPGADFAFFVFNSDDLAYAMFELGHFVGALGKGHVIVLHMSDVPVPKGIPGVVIRPIVVKLEEASLSIMKELKAAGYVLSI